MPDSSSSSSEVKVEVIDLSQLLLRLRLGIIPSIGLAAIGLALAAATFFLFSPFSTMESSTHVVFSFDGLGRGQYPDESKFKADDLREPEIVLGALEALNLNTSESFQSEIRSAITIKGVIPESIKLEREQMRENGQTPPTFIPDEYRVTLSLPRKEGITATEAENFLTQLVNGYQEHFESTYTEVPLEFGNTFEALEQADFFEFELILTAEIRSILSYLEQQKEQARLFRSRRTNFTFSDLIKQMELFNQIQLNETLGLIRENGLSRNRSIAMVKMDYYLQTLEDQELQAIEEEKVVLDLLQQTQTRGGNYVLGIKSEAVQSQPSTPLLDQGLIDSLLANDAYNYLVREALDAGLRLKRIQAEKAVLIERRETMQTFLDADSEDQSSVIAQVEASLDRVEKAYMELIENIRQTHEDYSRQALADSVRIVRQPETNNYFNEMVMAGIAGSGVGLALGFGLSLLGLLGRRFAAGSKLI